MAKRKIYLGPINSGLNGPLIVEGLAVDAFTPGELLVQSASGLATSALAAPSAILQKQLLCGLVSLSMQLLQSLRTSRAKA